MNCFINKSQIFCLSRNPFYNRVACQSSSCKVSLSGQQMQNFEVWGLTVVLNIVYRVSLESYLREFMKVYY